MEKEGQREREGSRRLSTREKNERVGPQRKLD